MSDPTTADAVVRARVERTLAQASAWVARNQAWVDAIRANWRDANAE